jgi:hypothetical protein
MCRFVIFEDEASDMIGTIEAALIKLNQPLWNVAIDGFGNHDPGRGRYEQAKSDWDVIHSGRPWAERCNGKHQEKSVIVANIENYFKTCQVYTLYILNRWGNVIHQQKNYEPPFEGKGMDGSEVEDGVYMYRLDYEKGTKSGFFHLIRCDHTQLGDR